MASIPILATERLTLRPFAAADLDAYAAMCADAEVMRHIGDGGPVGRDVAWRQLAFFLGHWGCAATACGRSNCARADG